MRRNNLGSPTLLQSAPAIGSHDDIYNRLIQQLPTNWWGNSQFLPNNTPSSHPVLDTALESFITTMKFCYQQMQYVQLQMRLQTATQDNLDLISQDYLGDTLPRYGGENDDSYRTRIEATLLQEKATRNGLSNALYLLTGFQPILFEPWRPLDCGGYNDYTSLAYSTQGKYGSGSFAYQGFADVYVGQFQGMASYNGYNSLYGGYNSTGINAQLWYGSQSLENTIISDQFIYQTINLTKVFGTIVWTRIHRTAI